MLKQLLIRNIALIDEIVLPFDEGLNILTGETGAGKSIVVDSISMLLGSRADREKIRTGCDKAYVEGVFDIGINFPVRELLVSQNIESEDNLVTLSRELNTAGRSVSRLCGVVVSLPLYKEVAALLMDIHGQYEQHSLLDDKRHIVYLDNFGDNVHQSLKAEVKTAFDEYKIVKTQYDEILLEGRQRAERLDFLRYQEKELSAANLRANEEDDLTRERDRFRNMEKIDRMLRRAYTVFYAAESKEDSAVSLIRTAMQAVGEIASLGDDFLSLYNRIESLYYDAEDIGLSMRSQLENLDTEPGRYESISERLDLIRRLSRKYGSTTVEMLENLHGIHIELERMEGLDSALEKYKKELESLHCTYKTAAKKLTASRIELAKRFETKMEEQLRDLNMSGTRFCVDFAFSEGGFASLGDESVSFLIAPNTGEESRPLSKIASGGELSRLMLAIKSIAAERSMIPSMVFDEIDTGISGRTAQVVAEKLWDIARFRQVICVTHLQQIAAMASRHYLVEKDIQNNRTITRVRILDKKSREHELSRMLSGVSSDSESSLAHARAMLSEAQAYKL